MDHAARMGVGHRVADLAEDLQQPTAIGDRIGVGVTAGGDLTLTGGASNTGTYAQIGLGGLNSDASKNGGTTVEATNISLASGAGANAYTQIGAGGTSGSGNITGPTSVTANGGTVSVIAGSGQDAYAQLGAGGTKANGTHSSSTTVSADGAVTVQGGSGDNSYASIGLGGMNLDGALAGITTVTTPDAAALPCRPWTDDGVVVTANHVIERDDRIMVGLPGGETVAATLAGRDPGTDIAVVRVTGATAPGALGGALRVGELVLAVGRPGSGGIEASLGAVAAVGGPCRSRGGVRVSGFVRSDTTFFPGFYGGALVNRGALIAGMNTSHLGHGGITLPVSAIEPIVSALLHEARVFAKTLSA